MPFTKTASPSVARLAPMVTKTVKQAVPMRVVDVKGDRFEPLLILLITKRCSMGSA
jgi:hypothetical protein